MARQIKVKGVKLVKPEFEEVVKKPKVKKEVVEEVVEVEEPKPIRKRKVKSTPVALGEELHRKVLDIEQLSHIYIKATDIVSAMDRKLQDLLHDLEDDALSYHEIASLGKQIKDLRRERRIAKDTEVLLRDIYDILQDGQTKHSLNKIKAEAGKIKNKEKKLEERVYTYREQ